MVRGRGPEGPGGGSLLGRRSGIFGWCGCRGSHAGKNRKHDREVSSSHSADPEIRLHHDRRNSWLHLRRGAELAMVCDLVIAAGETQIGQPEISLGCYPPVAAAYLPGAIGFHKASEMVLMGEPIHAAEAERAGLVNKVVPRTSLSEAVDAYVAKLLAKSSTVLALTKRALREGAGHHFEKALDRSQQLYLRDLTRTEDMVEGMNAFLEKRPPAWRNR